jgi:zinc transporter ZupT
MSAVVLVLLYATLTALATGLGALPFLAVERVPRRWIGVANAVAAGLMLTASFNLVHEGLSYGEPLSYGNARVVGGLLLGLALIVASRRALAGREEEAHVGELRGAGAMKAFLIVGVMTAHSFAEGIGVGVSFGGSESFGTFISAAIAVHNVPEGLAISLVLVPQGVSVGRAAFWSIVSSLPQPLMAVPAFLFVESFRTVLPVGLGLAAGAMIWMVFSELVPDALEDASPGAIAAGATLSVAAMTAFQAWIG